MDKMDNSLGCFFKGFVAFLIVLPFVVHFGLTGDYWDEQGIGGLAIFIPIWLSLGVAIFAKGISRDHIPAKEDTLLKTLVFLTVISFVGSTVMLMKINATSMFLDYGIACFLLSVLVAAGAHLFHIVLLVLAYKIKKKGPEKTASLPRDLFSDEEDDEESEVAEEYDDSPNWLDDYDMTKNYYGKHGEFDKNDDSWGTSEYIRQFKNNDRRVDLSDHFDWQEKVEAESDGFLVDNRDGRK